MGRQVTHVFFFAGGNTAVCNRDKQIPELQQSWLLMFIEFLQSKGVKVEDIEEIRLPDGSQAEYLKESHNWRIK